MLHQLTTFRKVVATVIRNTRVQDSSYISDIHEWLYEAMDMLETQTTLVGKSAAIETYFHKAKLPCGLRWIDGVQCGSHRLQQRGGTRPADMYTPPQVNASAFGTSINITPTTNGHTQYITQLTQLFAFGILPNAHYYIDGGVLNTSYPDMKLTLFYRAVPTDKDGFPEIPDNTNYMQALYWYCRSQMIGSGWEDKTFNHQYCMLQFEHFAARALGEIRMPSPEQMQHRVDTFVRFIPDQNYYDSFFESSPEPNFR